MAQKRAQSSSQPTGGCATCEKHTWDAGASEARLFVLRKQLAKADECSSQLIWTENTVHSPKTEDKLLNLLRSVLATESRRPMTLCGRKEGRLASRQVVQPYNQTHLTKENALRILSGQTIYSLQAK